MRLQQSVIKTPIIHEPALGPTTQHASAERHDLKASRQVGQLYTSALPALGDNWTGIRCTDVEQNCDGIIIPLKAKPMAVFAAFYAIIDRSQPTIK